MAVNRIRTSATAQRRQHQIEDCLIENLTHNPWQSISVADICRQVGISRKAYYNYYKDKGDCFCAYVDRLLRECILQATQRLPDEATTLDAAVAMLDFWKGQKAFLDIVVHNDLGFLLIQRNIDFVLTEDRSLLKLLNTRELPSDADILTCYTSLQLTLVLCWYGRNFEDPTEEMARKLLRLLHEPLLPPAEG